MEIGLAEAGMGSVTKGVLPPEWVNNQSWKQLGTLHRVFGNCHKLVYKYHSAHGVRKGSTICLKMSVLCKCLEV